MCASVYKFWKYILLILFYFIECTTTATTWYCCSLTTGNKTHVGRPLRGTSKCQMWRDFFFFSLLCEPAWSSHTLRSLDSSFLRAVCVTVRKKTVVAVDDRRVSSRPALIRLTLCLSKPGGCCVLCFHEERQNSDAALSVCWPLLELYALSLSLSSTRTCCHDRRLSGFIQQKKNPKCCCNLPSWTYFIQVEIL